MECDEKSKNDGFSYQRVVELETQTKKSVSN